MSETKTITSLSLMLDKEMFALDISSVREIQDYTDITRIPQMPPYMRGVVNLRGKAIPVLDLRMKFGLGETEKTIYSRIIILEVPIEGERCEVGILADAVREVFEIDRALLMPPPRVGHAVDTRLLRGIARYGERFIMLLDIERLFSEDDLGMLKDMGEEQTEDAPSEEHAVAA